MKLEFVTIKKLLDNGFWLSPKQSSGEMDVYIKSIPVYSYQNVPRLYAYISVQLPQKAVIVDIYDNNRQLYAPYYNREWHHSHLDFVKKLDHIIEMELSKINTKPTKRRRTRD